ncbi:MAG: DUF2282 domain-containing protein [Rhodomicrobium sp.]
MSNPSCNAALAGAFAAALALSAVPAQAADQAGAKEKCYGIAMAGRNDCASTGNNSCAGTAKADYEKGAWMLVPKGTCLTAEVTLKSGAKQHGTLEPGKS